MLLVHTVPAQALQSTFRHQWARTVAGSTSTLSLYRRITTCLSISSRPGLRSGHGLQAPTQSLAVAEGRRYSSHTAPTSPQQSPFSLSSIFIGVLIFGGAYTLGSVYPPTLIELISPRPAPAPPLEGSLEAKAKQQEIEAALWALPQVQARLKTAQGPRPDVVPVEFRGSFRNDTVQVPDDWTHYVVRPYLHVHPHIKQHSLTAGLLQGPGRMITPPLALVRSDEREMETYLHVGRSVCGHDGIVHGGLLATILDEAMARLAVMNLDARVAVTANLTINYRAPTRADQFIVVKTRLVSVKGRKAEVSARIEDLNGVLLVDGSSLFIQPKYAHLLQGVLTNKVLGIPEEPPQEKGAAIDDRQ